LDNARTIIERLASEVAERVRSVCAHLSDLHDRRIAEAALVLVRAHLNSRSEGCSNVRAVMIAARSAAN
jgi:hypothetical protein